MNQSEYRLNCAQYVFYRDGVPVQAPQDEIALAFSAGDGILHKHGKPETVHCWAAGERAKLCANLHNKTLEMHDISEEMSRDLVTLQGRFLLEDLNACLTTPGYVGKLYAKAKAGTLGSLDIRGNPTLTSSPP